MTDQIKLLVIEDQEKHVKDAEKYFSEAPRSEIVVPRFCGTLSEAESEISSKQYHGVITDMFFPIGCGDPKRQEVIKGLEEQLKPYLQGANIREMDDAFQKWVIGKSLPPTGVRASMIATENGLPVVINTACYHHGFAYQPVHEWRGCHDDVFGDCFKYVESGVEGDMTGEGDFKDWEKAYFYIALDIACRNEKLDFCNIQKLLKENQTDHDHLLQRAKYFDEQYKEAMIGNPRYQHSLPILKAIAAFRERYNIGQGRSS